MCTNVFSQFKNIIKFRITAVIWWSDKHQSKILFSCWKCWKPWTETLLVCLLCGTKNAIHFVYKMRFLFCVLNALRYWCTDPVDVTSVFFKINFSICHLLLCNHWTGFFKVPTPTLFPSKSDLSYSSFVKIQMKEQMPIKTCSVLWDCF